jgi:HAD superfamily hydrolase (TIGR01509 family)
MAVSQRLASLKWIFFDIGGVLVDESRWTERLFESILVILKRYKMSVTRSDIEAAWPSASGRVGDLGANLISELLPSQALAVEAERGLNELLPKNNYPTLVRVRPEAKDVLRNLSQHYYLGIAANQGFAVKDMLISAGLLQFFTHKRVSVEYGYEKPQREFFTTILTESKANALESAFVDDNIERGLLPAHDLGMATIWYRSPYSGERPSASIDLVIQSLRELPTFL